VLDRAGVAPLEGLEQSSGTQPAIPYSVQLQGSESLSREHGIGQIREFD
jgi:hypothetical protein